MIRSKRSIATAVIASVAVLACSDPGVTAPMNGGPTPVAPPLAVSHPLKVMADCSQYTGQAGSYCTIVTSNLPAIGVGSTIVYAAPAGTTSLQSDVAVDQALPGTSVATGHCDLDLTLGRGPCTFSDGTGTLAGFHASVAATHVGGSLWYWDGTYSIPSPI